MLLSQGRQQYALDIDTIDLDYDVDRLLGFLDNAADNPEALFEALDLYSGPYLPWSSNLWSAMLRAEIEQRFLHALRVAANSCEHVGAYLDALSLYRRLLVIDSLDEAGHAGIMRCQLALGNRAAAIGQYETLRKASDKELGLDRVALRRGVGTAYTTRS